MKHATLKMEIISLLTSIEDKTRLLEISKFLKPEKENPVDVPKKKIQSKWAIDLEQVLELMNQADKIKKLIGEKEEKNERILRDVQEMIRRAIIDWEPTYNEKAVCIMLDKREGWHVWRVNSYSDEKLTFREAPADFNPRRMNHEYTIDLSKPVKKADFYVIPEAFFEELNEYLPFHIFADEYKRFENL